MYLLKFHYLFEPRGSAIWVEIAWEVLLMLPPGVAPAAVAVWWVVSEGLGSGSQPWLCPTWPGEPGVPTWRLQQQLPREQGCKVQDLLQPLLEVLYNVTSSTFY